MYRHTWTSPNAHLCVSLHVALVEADFVGSALVREGVNSSVGDDDKIYFFFTEKSQEPTAFGGQGRVARVARICKVRFLPRPRQESVHRAFILFSPPCLTHLPSIHVCCNFCCEWCNRLVRLEPPSAFAQYHLSLQHSQGSLL